MYNVQDDIGGVLCYNISTKRKGNDTMFKYWVVEEVYCFDTCVSKKYLNFRTKEDAYKYYTSNRDKFDGFYNSLYEPKEVVIKFEEDKEEE